MRDWRRRNTEKIKDYRDKRKQDPTYSSRVAKKTAKYGNTLAGAVTTMLSLSKNRAKGNDLEHSLEREDLFELWDEQDGKCAISGLEMTTERGSLKKVSLDKIDPTGGYARNNVQLVCKWANFAKNGATNEEILAIMEELRA
jgi:hypothetical protein